MKKLLVLITVFLMACGGASHPTLTDVVLDMKKKRNDMAYDKLSRGLYSKKTDKSTQNLQSISDAWFRMGKLHKHKNEPKKALAAFTKARELDKKNKVGKKIDDLLVFWSRTIYNKSLKYYNESLGSKDKEKKLIKVEGLLNTAVIYKKEDYIYSLLGKTYNNLKRGEKAAEAFKKAIAMNDSNVANHLDLGFTYFDLKKYEESAKAFKKVLSLDPKNKYALKYLPFAYQNLKEFNKAVEAYKKALEADPKDQEIATNLGTAYIIISNDYITKFNELNKAGKTKAAKEELKKCASLLEEAITIEAHKENPDLWGTLVVVYGQLGEKKKAKHADKMEKKYR
jgi:tetratricopeptide (TPR) repeat protein